MTGRASILAVALALAGSPAGAATFLDTIGCEIPGVGVEGGGGVICSPSTAAINPAVRFSDEFFIAEEETFTTFFAVDFEPFATGAVLNLRATRNVIVTFAKIQFRNLSDYWASASFLGVRGFVPKPDTPGADGLTAADVTLSNGLLTIDLSGSFAARNDLARIQLTEGPPPIAAVPEPATWAMMIAGFGLAGTFARLRSRLTAPSRALA